MKKVWIKPGCISCGTCEFIAPEVFQVVNTSQIKKDADLNLHHEKIKQAQAACPVFVIDSQE